MKRFINSAPAWLRNRAGKHGARAALVSVAGGLGTALRHSLRHGLSVAGIAGIAAFGVLYFNPHLAEDIIALSPFSSESMDEALAGGDVSGNVMAAPVALAVMAPAPIAVAPVKAEPARPVESTPLIAKAVPGHPEQQRVTNWIARRYRVATDAANMLVGATYATAREIHLDPLLILAVIAIESRFNPFAESPVGAKGLMQVMANVHRDKFQPLGGVQAALNPIANIKVGSSILKEYVKRTGSLEGGLKAYVGAADNETDAGYGSKVIAEYNKLKEVAHGSKPAAKSLPAPGTPKREQRTQEARNGSEIGSKGEPA
ncbi:transglycosylase SLT domain-containing protein [Lacisediminimonas profundi]|uniref:transglycosylase SLT domain-containing protein n=1 Tax=Lacisediminimonas profundi TaxID=2603856 RepID=UPI001F5040C1|nr:transglycosylase SLT domain-containing protein [Lacisediminimonas profundi]